MSKQANALREKYSFYLDQVIQDLNTAQVNQVAQACDRLCGGALSALALITPERLKEQLPGFEDAMIERLVQIFRIPPPPVIATTLAKFKVTLIGASCVGKSELFARHWDMNHSGVPTIGVHVDEDDRLSYRGERIMMELWDTAGEERFAQVIAWFVLYKHKHLYNLPFQFYP